MNWGVRKRGYTLVEVLVGILVVAVAAIGALSFFSYGWSGIARQGYRRAAAERAREQMEELAAADVAAFAINNPSDGALYWLICNGSPCVWTQSNVRVVDNVSLGGLFNGQREITAQRVHDRTTETPPATLDAVELSVRVWFTANTGADDDFNRVQLKTLRAHSP